MTLERHSYAAAASHGITALAPVDADYYKDIDGSNKAKLSTMTMH